MLRILDFFTTSEGMALYFVVLIIFSCVVLFLAERMERRIKRRLRRMRYRAKKLLPAYQLYRAQMRQLKRKRRSLAVEGIRLIVSLLRG